ncbi:MAG TPA: phage holin family protein [Jatrophihabitans sp.]|nr:phage holin family protein [Jatrophihabitans sp.]
MTGSPTPAARASAPPVTLEPTAAEPSLGKLVSDASVHMSTLVRSEIELAKLELRTTAKNAGTGVGAFIGAAVVFVFSLTFGFLALAEGLVAAGLWRWAAYLVVFGLQLVIVALLILIGYRKVKRVKAPEKTIQTTKETVDYLKSSRTSGS